MMRLVTEQVDPPFFMLLCDHPNCGTFITYGCTISALSPTPLQAQEVNFLTEAKNNGWALSMRQQICPHHVNQARKMQQQVQPGAGGAGGQASVGIIGS